jgi:3-hydroxyisobutyrate dehydrogenase-like beta-hydroxyacid dehydrogenase
MPPLQPPPAITKIGFIGYGEAAAAFAGGWRDAGGYEFLAFDIKTDTAGPVRDQKLQDFSSDGVTGFECAGECAAGADVVLSMVAPDQAVIAAQSVIKDIPAGCFFLDCNSCSPGRKKQASAIIGNAGGRYVDVAIMAPVHPDLHKTSLLISGKWATEALEIMVALGMSARPVPGEVGNAAAVKMIRSVMMKGLEGLVAECVLSARKAGVDEMVLASLEKTYEGMNWSEFSAYCLERMMVHGERRAAEMGEVALSLEQMGMDNPMSKATADWQRRIADLCLNPGENTYQGRADAILLALGTPFDQEEPT